MIRYILRHRSCDGNCGEQSEHVQYSTIDGDAAEVERRLRRGGKGTMGFEVTELVGVEVIDDAPKSEKPTRITDAEQREWKARFAAQDAETQRIADEAQALVDEAKDGGAKG